MRAPVYGNHRNTWDPTHILRPSSGGTPPRWAREMSRWRTRRRLRLDRAPPPRAAGMVGLKPTQGPQKPSRRSPATGPAALPTSTRVSSVRDAALPRRTHGPGPGDPLHRYAAARPLPRGVRSLPRPLRIATPRCPPTARPSTRESSHAPRNGYGFALQLAITWRRADRPDEAGLVIPHLITLAPKVNTVVKRRPIRRGPARGRGEVETHPGTPPASRERTSSAHYVRAPDRPTAGPARWRPSTRATT